MAPTRLPSVSQRVGALLSRRRAYLCSYPKSGRTWLRFILHGYLNAHFDLGAPDGLDGLFHVLPNDSADPERGRPAYRYAWRPSVPLILSSHTPYADHFATAPVVVLLRNPFDVLVSRYFHLSRQRDAFEGTLADFMGETGAAHLARWLNSWAEPAAALGALTITYEALHRNTVDIAASVLLRIGVPIDRALLEDAVERARFDRMQRLERTRGVPGHDYDRSDDDALRVRRGVVGGFGDYLSGEVLDDARRALETALSTPARAWLGTYHLDTTSAGAKSPQAAGAHG